MNRHRQNLPWQYHNGGVWPFVGGFWVCALAHSRQTALARAELRSLARANSVGGWAFNEWLHGRTSRPRGMPGQSWNAAMYLLACSAVAKLPRSS
jgi:glycogen debranching enzyme